MGRPNRPIEDGLVYHAINRGNDRSAVFLDETDHVAFLDAMAKTQSRYPFDLYGYCLMTNHFHLLLRPGPGQSISRIVQSLTVAHTWRYHKRHRGVGHVWQGRFRSPVIQDDAHLLVVLRYIEANPRRAKMVEDLAEYPWSSYGFHGVGRPDALLSPMPEWDALGATAIDRRARWREKVLAPEVESELAALRLSVRSGRPYGSEEWVASRLKQGSSLPPSRPRGRPRRSPTQ